jgi:hypothetical protein
MVVASGQLVYEYSKAFGDEFNWRMPSDYPIIQPSAILWEEAMYCLKAEYNRVTAESSGFRVGYSNAGSVDFAAARNGTFIKWINSNATGEFDPHQSGEYLSGRIDTVIGNAPPSMPGTINAGYLKDMKNVFRAIVSRISRTSNATPQEVMQFWLQDTKKYTDTYATSGFFFQEIADWSLSDAVGSGKDPVFVNGYNLSNWDVDEYENVFIQDDVHSGVWLTPRHIDELRIQPIPYIASTSGTMVPTSDGAGHNKNFVTSYPVRPNYCRTDGTVQSQYGNKIKIWGNALVSGIVVQLSGEGSVVEQDSYTAAVGGFSEHLPMSGEFTPASTMGSGWYAVFIGASGDTPGIGLESGLFPWGTTVNETTPQVAYWPRIAHPPVPGFDNYVNAGGSDLFVTSESAKDAGEFGQEGFLVSDRMWASQIWLTKQFSSNNRNVSESGLSWYAPHPVEQDGNLINVDFFDGSGAGSGPGGSGRIWWGSEYEGKQVNNSPSQYWHAGAYSSYRANGTIIRGHTSGTSSSIPGNGFSNGNEGVWITEWSLPLHSPTFNSITSGNITTGGIVWSHRADNMTSITHDDTRFVCAGIVERASGTTASTLGGFAGTSKSYWVNDSTYTIINVGWVINGSGNIPPLGIRNKPLTYYYAHGLAEYLGAVQPDWAGSAIGGAPSGQYVVVTWDFTSPFTAMSGQETRDWNTPTFGSGDISEGLISQLVDTPTVRITHFFQDEANDELYAFLQAEVSGTSDNHRWVSRLDTTGGHPYELRETYDLGLEATEANQGVNLNRSLNSNFMIGFDY